MGGKADAVIHVRLGDKEMKTKVTSGKRTWMNRTLRSHYSRWPNKPMLCIRPHAAKAKAKERERAKELACRQRKARAKENA